jgi:ubiquinone/menaquinone biosynthesis C-methylase UbiE
MPRKSLDQPASGLLNDSAAIEEARIRQAYANRKGDEARYSLFSPGHLFSVQQRERKLIALMDRNGMAALKSKKLLEIGCGTGFWLREFVKWGARPENITGVDLLPERFVEAKALCPDGVRLQCRNASHLEFENSTFDLVIQSTVFTSILDAAMKQQVAREMLRVLKDDGLILWYDYHMNNPKNADVKGVKMREIRKLFPGCEIQLQRATLAPPIARLLAPYSWILCYFLEKIPWLCTHYIGVIGKSKTR